MSARVRENRDRTMTGTIRAGRLGLCAMLSAGLVMSASARTNTTGAGATSGSVLRLGTGAAQPAMGDAGVSNTWGVAAMHYNPAGLGFTNRAEISAMYQNLVLDISQGDLAFSHPINNVSSWGLGVTYLDYGKTQRVTLADVINNSTPSTSFGGQDFVFSGAYGRQFNEYFSAGITGKVLNQQIDNKSATAVMADVGLLFRPANFPVRIGVTGANLGSKVNFNITNATSARRSENLPALVRAGAAVDLFNNHLTITGEVEKVRDQAATAQVGAEARIMEMLAFRIGWDGRVQADDGLTGGIGIKVNDLAIDYAFVPYGNLGNNHRIALTYKFGPNY